MIIELLTPEWTEPLFCDKRYKGARGGRGSGKSHFFAEKMIEDLVTNPDKSAVCVREIQKSLQYSSKKLLENKIEALGVSHYFEITTTEIRCLFGKGVIIFSGLQDHTADSIKSLEDFAICWVEEAQSISKRSMELLIPTIRANGSEVWFSWNPEQPDDPVEKHFQDNDHAVVVTVNYHDNPLCPDVIMDEAKRMRRLDYENYCHIYLGQFRSRSDAQIFAGKYEVSPFEITEKHGMPLHGLDFGFSQDPTAITRSYIKDNTLYINREAGKTGLELDDTVGFAKDQIPNIDKYPLPCDSARPESISHLNKHGLPRAYGVKKWAGSIEDGLSFMKMFENIIIHPRCVNTANEFKMYSYKIDKRTDEITSLIEDKHNHYIDSIRYALGKLIRPRDFGEVGENTESFF